MTRRTVRFAALAHGVEEQLRKRGVVLESEVVDQILRNRVDTGAELMRVTPRTALDYAPADLPEIVARAIVEAAETLPETMPCGRPAPSLTHAATEPNTRRAAAAAHPYIRTV